MSPEKQRAWWHLTMARMLGASALGCLHMLALRNLKIVSVPPEETWRWTSNEFDWLAQTLSEVAKPDSTVRDAVVAEREAIIKIVRGAACDGTVASLRETILRQITDREAQK